MYVCTNVVLSFVTIVALKIGHCIPEYEYYGALSAQIEDIVGH